MPPAAARRQEQQQAHIAAVLVLALTQAWRQMAAAKPWETTWQAIAPGIVQTVAAAQEAAAAQSGAYVLASAAEAGIPVGSTALAPSALAGVAGDGRDLGSLLYGAVVETAKSYEQHLADLEEQLARKVALLDGQDWLEMAAATAVSDASRGAQKVVMAEQTKITGWVRLIEPGACSRCVVLAGRFYRWSEGFERHPRCRCEHVPATEDNKRFANSRTNPNLYFDRLSPQEQDRVFTKAGAEAIRLGADISQVVNARRGMQKAQLYGRDVLITTEGTTRRGGFGYLEAKRGGELVGRNVGRRGAVKNYTERRAKRARLMPETILAEARDRDDAVRLLRLYGYLT